VRKASPVLAVLATALLSLLLASPLEARAVKKHPGRHSTNSPAAQARQKKPRTLIYQNVSGDVVLERVDVVALNYHGPVYPREVHDYPQPPCEPVDMVVEVQVHDAELGNPDTLEVENAEVSREISQASAPARAVQGLSRIAHKLGSFFRPKSSESSVRPEHVDLDILLSQRLLIPVEGVDVEKLRDSFLSQRGKYAKHLAIDIGAPRGTPVLATTDGQVVKVIREQRGGRSLYQKDATGKYLFFYCHLNGYADGVAPGRQVRKGDVIGYVGATGHVIGGPHLHFSITRLPDDSANFKAGLAINPYLLFLAGVP